MKREKFGPRSMRVDRSEVRYPVRIDKLWRAGLCVAQYVGSSDAFKKSVTCTSTLEYSARRVKRFLLTSLQSLTPHEKKIR
jgi:hypothetical protein